MEGEEAPPPPAPGGAAGPGHPPGAPTQLPSTDAGPGAEMIVMGSQFVVETLYKKVKPSCYMQIKFSIRSNILHMQNSV